MAERFKAAVLKTVVGLNPPRVRIPVSPQKSTPKGVFCCGRLGENLGGSTMQTNESRTQTACLCMCE